MYHPGCLTHKPNNQRVYTGPAKPTSRPKLQPSLAAVAYSSYFSVAPLCNQWLLNRKCWADCISQLFDLCMQQGMSAYAVFGLTISGCSKIHRKKKRKMYNFTVNIHKIQYSTQHSVNKTVNGKFKAEPKVWNCRQMVCFMGYLSEVGDEHSPPSSSRMPSCCLRGLNGG